MFEILKKVSVLALMFSVSGCGAVLQNPEIRTAEFNQELRKQTQLLESYKKKNKNIKKAPVLFQNAYEYDAYLANFMDTMLVKNRDLCAYQMYTLGLQYSDKVVLKGKLASKKYKDFPQVYGLTDAFPAQKSGLKKGDIFLKVNGASVTNQTYDMIMKSLNTTKTSHLEIFRPSTGQTKKIAITGKKSCQMLLITYEDETLNATADGTVVRMYTGLINFLGKEQYIQAVLAHEIAHNIMAHRYRSTRNAGAGLLLGAVLGAVIAKNGGGNVSDTVEQVGQLGADVANATYSHEFEAESDYLGAYLMARAGYDIDNIHNTWRRMSLLSDSSSDLGRTTTHPAVPKRFVALSKTIREIKSKIKEKQQLLPKFKESSWTEIKQQQRSVY